MRRTGRYKLLNLVFGCLPFCAALLLTRLREDSGPAHTWLTIVCLAIRHDDISDNRLDASWIWQCSRFADDVQ